MHLCNEKSQKKLFIKEVRFRLDSYLQIVIRNLRDLIPKAIGHIMITVSIDKLAREINEGINSTKDIVDCMKEV